MMVDKKDDAMVRWKAESMVVRKVYRKAGGMDEMIVGMMVGMMVEM